MVQPRSMHDQTGIPHNQHTGIVHIQRLQQKSESLDTCQKGPAHGDTALLSGFDEVVGEVGLDEGGHGVGYHGQFAVYFGGEDAGALAEGGEHVEAVDEHLLTVLGAQKVVVFRSRQDLNQDS